MATLLNVLGIPRWGNIESGEIEQTFHNGTMYMDYTSINHNFQILWDTKVEGRYPNLKEFEVMETMC